MIQQFRCDIYSKRFICLGLFVVLFISTLIGILTTNISLPSLDNSNLYDMSKLHSESNILKIFFNNVRIDLLIIIAGLFSFGVSTLILIALNGFFFGITFSLAIQEFDYTWMKIVYELLPHALIEIPVFLYAGSLSFTIVQAVYDNLVKQQPARSIKVKVKMLGYGMIFIVIFNMISAIIEIVF